MARRGRGLAGPLPEHMADPARCVLGLRGGRPSGGHARRARDAGHTAVDVAGRDGIRSLHGFGDDPCGCEVARAKGGRHRAVGTLLRDRGETAGSGDVVFRGRSDLENRRCARRGFGRPRIVLMARSGRTFCIARGSGCTSFSLRSAGPLMIAEHQIGRGHRMPRKGGRLNILCAPVPVVRGHPGPAPVRGSLAAEPDQRPLVAGSEQHRSSRPGRCTDRWP